MTRFLYIVVSHTPLWVWALLAYLVAKGLAQARDHRVPEWRVVLQPLAMGLFSFVSASTVFGWQAAAQPAWLGAAGFGFVVGSWQGWPRKVRALPEGGFAIGGSWIPLMLILAIFALRYVCATALAIAPTLTADTWFTAAACALYGLPAGLLSARARKVLGHAPSRPRWAIA